MASEPTAPNAWQAFRSDRRRQTTVAYVLWVVLAGVIWNVVFDRVLVLAGRRYVYEASRAHDNGGSAVLIDPWMHDARRRAVRLATLAALPVAMVGMIAVRMASRQRTASSTRVQPPPPHSPAAR